MNRILLIGFDYLGQWQYAKLFIQTNPQGYLLKIVLQDENLRALLPASEEFVASRNELWMQLGNNRSQHGLRRVVALAIANALNLAVRFSDTLPEENKSV